MKKYDVTITVLSPKNEDFLEFKIKGIKADTEEVAKVFALSYAKEMIDIEVEEIEEVK